MAEDEAYDVMQQQDGNAPVTHTQYRALRMHFQRQLDLGLEQVNTTLQNLDLQVTELQQSIDDIKTMLEDKGNIQHVNAVGRGHGNMGGRGGDHRLGNGHNNGAFAEEQHAAAHHRMGNFQPNHEDDGLGKPKFTIPKFEGSTDVEEFLSWELKIDKLFRMYEYSEDKKIKLAASEFDGYALLWWENLVNTRAELGEPPIVTWAGMKREMRARFVPRHYTRSLYEKLQNLKQGIRSVDEYYQEMELIIQRARVREAEEQTMQRFLSGLNYQIKRIVKHYPYTNIIELLHQAREAETQLAEDAKFNARTTAVKSRFISKAAETRMPSSGTNSGFRGTSSSKTESSISNSRKSEQPAASAASAARSTPSNKDIFCHKCKRPGHMKRECPNNKAMLINEETGEYETEDEEEPNHEFLGDEVDDPDGPLYAEATHLPSIVCMPKVLSVVPSAAEEQRCNLFQTKAIVGHGKACKVIIDGGSCHNLASKELCTKLNLKYLPHPNPYYIQWLSDHGELKISHMVRVNFQIGPYQDTVECDVVPMTVCHLLLGRPWQLNHAVIHDGRANTYKLKWRAKEIVLRPMTPQ